MDRKLKKLKTESDVLMQTVEGYIDSFAAHTLGGTEVGAVLDDAVGTRGKMLRPRLLLLAGECGPDFDAAQDRLCRLAAMIELTHMASLIHDDIVDEAPCRRGKPSVQGKYGKDAAVYAGDFLMSRVSYHIAQEELNRSGAVLAKTVEEMCAGEIGQAACRYREDVTLQEYLRNIHGKTAALFMAACRIGAMESGCDAATVRTLELFGEQLGLLFQLRDDLLDFTSDVLAIGKAVHRDFQEGIYTMPVLCALEQPGGREALAPIMRANARGKLTLEQLHQMERQVEELGGVEATRQEIRSREKCAEQLLLSVLGRKGVSPALLAMARKLGTV